MPDGRFLDLGRHRFGTPGPRAPELREHPGLGLVLPKEEWHSTYGEPDYYDQERVSRTTGIMRWLYAPQMMPEGEEVAATIDIMRMPTAEQWATLARFLKENPVAWVQAYVAGSSDGTIAPRTFDLRGAADFEKLKRYTDAVYNVRCALWVEEDE